MSKINCFVLTVIISFFSLFLFKTETTISFKRVTHAHDIKIDNAYNAYAISVDNSIHELLNFDKQKKPTHGNVFYTFKTLKNVFLNETFNYLKVCDLIDLNLTTRIIIYPFHSFL